MGFHSNKISHLVVRPGCIIYHLYYHPTNFIIKSSFSFSGTLDDQNKIIGWYL